METPQTTGLVGGWTFRILLLVGALTGLLDFAENMEHRLQVSTFGIPATIERASKIKVPPVWSDSAGNAMFYVKIKPEQGPEFSADLYLSKADIDALQRGETKRIVFAEGNPRRFIFQGAPLPPIGFGWLTVGVVSFALFLYSLRLR